MTSPVMLRSNRFAGARRKVIETVKAAPKPKPLSPSGVRRVAAETVTRENGRIVLGDFAHVRTMMPTYNGRGGYRLRGAGDQLSPRQLAAARRNLEYARAARRRRG